MFRLVKDMNIVNLIMNIIYALTTPACIYMYVRLSRLTFSLTLVEKTQKSNANEHACAPLYYMYNNYTRVQFFVLKGY